MIVVVTFYYSDDSLQAALRKILKPGDRLITVLRGELEDHGYMDLVYPCQAIIERRKKP